MIATSLPKKAGVRDNYSRLAQYILAAEEKGEKLDKFWISNCDSGVGPEDLDLALVEIEAVRKLKPDIDNKTYHMAVSFRPGEHENLTEKDLHDIEQAFAKALGFEDHQRIAGTHINTNNFHMHIAFNKVHPKTLKVLTPHYDYKILEKTARELEKKYGLSVDRGMSDRDPHEPSLSNKAKDFEAQTWQQSFQSYLMEHRDEITDGLNKAVNWQEVHKSLAELDAGIKKRGNGLVFHHLKDKQTMKASSLDRSCSLKAMEKRLGAFEPPKMSPEKTTKAPKHKYEAKPLLKKNPYSSQLWNRFLATKQAFPKTSLFSRAKANWKLFLISEAHADPLAMVLLIAHQELLHKIFGPNSRTVASVPNSIAPALTALLLKMDAKKAINTTANQIKSIPKEDNSLIGFTILDKAGKVITTIGGNDLRLKMGKKAQTLTSDSNPKNRGL
ncbi:MAG: relaxase/mobilization nuclease domain-containing protein [Alphaproteobacteria bacterium]|nr:relaxase/mobilization nuclease domain-containing protein [Rhodospirillales bacterium]MCW9046265.1 relaxase/mobilization nuclease domain-containing protein [Alphaproteobacteria bacterium]